MTLLTLTLGLTVAHAQAQDVFAEPPPAIPATLDAPAVAGPRRPPTRSPERLQSLRQYQDERLTLRPETEVHGGGVMVVGGGVGVIGRGPYGGVQVGGMIPGAVFQEPVTLERSWGVYRGPERLTTPDLLREGGENIRAEDLERDIRRAKLASNVWLGVAGVGVATAVSGMMGLSIAEDRADAIFFNNVTVGGAGVAALGVVASSFPLTKARALKHEPSKTLGLDETQALVRRHNEALRVELGLSPDDVWQVESAPPPGR